MTKRQEMWRGCPHDYGFLDDAVPGGPPSAWHVRRTDEGFAESKYHRHAILFYTAKDRETAIKWLVAHGFTCIDGEEGTA